MNHPYISKEVSWLAFNARVLQEAADPTVPLVERLKFLGIFSSNLDEFFRVRVATLRRLLKIRKKAALLIGADPKKVLDEVQRIVLQQSESFDALYLQLLETLRQEGIFIHGTDDLTPQQQDFVRGFFHQEVRPSLVPLLLHRKARPVLRDHEIYLAVRMSPRQGGSPDYALIRIPTDQISRFVLLPGPKKERHLMLLDDVIRIGLPQVFAYFDYVSYEAYTVKLTRDSELDLDDELFKSFPQKMQDSLKKRKSGEPVRFVFDRDMPKDMLHWLQRLLGIADDEACIPGGRYHNFKDFMQFPKLYKKKYYFPPDTPAPHPAIGQNNSIFEVMRRQDLLLHFPYHTFDHFIDLLREAAIDPAVESIRLTVYRLARSSQIVNALISAVQNGKKVFVVVELQARFDEAANLQWADLLREDGVRVVHGVPGLKVHSKLCLITRREARKQVRYACVGTGNFNEDTAELYTDHMLLTADQRIVTETHRVFEFFENNYHLPQFRHLMVSPFQARNKMKRLIRNEMQAAAQGKLAWIDIKLNNLSDPETVRLLYEAASAGVRIRLICRSMFSLVPGIPGVSDNIEAISIVDRYLEHSRFFIFANGGRPVFYISSADWLPRNFDQRVEVACPIYDSRLQQELRDYFDLQWQDNTKARLLDEGLTNNYRECQPGAEAIRSQTAIAAAVRTRIAAGEDAVEKTR